MAPVTAGGEAIETRITAMLDARAPNATLCPSEVARAMATPDWRAAMAPVHDAVDRLAARGAIRLSWQGETLPARAGPYRIGRADMRQEDGAGAAASATPSGAGPCPT